MACLRCRTVKPAAGPLIAGIAVRTITVALIPVLLGALYVHSGSGWVFSNPNGGWEYPAFLVLASVVQVLLGPGKFAVRLPGGILSRQATVTG